MTKKHRTWLLLGQITISAGILTWLFLFVFRGDSDLSEISESWDSGSIFWTFSAVIFTALSFFFATYRWQKITETLEIRQPLFKMFMHFLSGQFVSTFLPSTIGGDFLRMTRLSMSTNNPQNSFASVVIDRFVGWPVLGVLSLSGFALSPGLFGMGTKTSLVAMLISAGTIIAFLVLSYLATHNNIIRRLTHARGTIWRYVSTINKGLLALRRNPKKAWEVVGITFVMQYSMVLAAACAARALNIDVTFFALLAFIPPVLIVQVIPISVGGFGVRETAIVVALHVVGVPEIQAIQLGLMLGLLNLVVGLFGAPSFAFGGTKRRKPVLVDAKHLDEYSNDV